jgi:hypothetical protein
MPRRPDRAVVAGGRLRITTNGQAEWALAAGMIVADFDEDVGVGFDTPGGLALLQFAWESPSSTAMILLGVDVPVQLRGPANASCDGATPTADELPLGALGAVHVRWRDGRLTVGTPTRTWLDCRPMGLPPRGALGLGAAAGTVLYDNWTITR